MESLLGLSSFLSSLNYLNYAPVVNLTAHAGELCYRDCSNTSARVCYYDWHMEHYHVLGPACGTCGLANGNFSDCYKPKCLTADGVERGVMSINRRITGPPIHVCQGDLIVVDVTNSMGGTGAALHWHGIHQRKSPHFDGVPFVTQCPIEFSTTFRYAFLASEVGTQFYHGHSGHHKANGQYGALIVRENPWLDPNFDLYDHDLKEHVLVISDWTLQYGEWWVPGLRSSQLGPTSLLINGRGTIVNATTGISKTLTPLSVFRVTRGHSYRFRMINSGSQACQMVLDIQNHTMMIISSDSFDLQPEFVDSIYSNPGERFDFVINAYQPNDTYLIRIRSVGFCSSSQLQQFAILTYKSESEAKLEDIAFPTTPFPPFSQVFGSLGSINNPDTPCHNSSDTSYCITDMYSYDWMASAEVSAKPDQSFCLAFANLPVNASEVFAPNNYGHFLGGSRMSEGAINNISFKNPSFNLLSQPEEIDKMTFCNISSLPASCNGQQICQCTHRLKVKLNSIVELTVLDPTTSPGIGQLHHPFHLHGHQLYVTAMGRNPDGSPMTCDKARALTNQQNDYKGLLPMKDTVSIPAKGFITMRFKADNAGYWLLHCHYEWHMGNGMAVLLQVGNPEQMVKSPADFPKCKNFKPDIRKTKCFD